MKKFRKIKKTVEEKVVDKVRCDICGKWYKVEHGNMSPTLNFSTTGGYLTDFDGTYIEFDICNECMKKIINGDCIRFKSIYTKDLW